MTKKPNAANVPNAGKIDGARKTQCGCRFPVLERDGVKVVFTPAQTVEGENAGWNIFVLNPIAKALEAADNALCAAIGDIDTADMWGDLIPSHNAGDECVLMLACSRRQIETFVDVAMRNGFETNGGAE